MSRRGFHASGGRHRIWICPLRNRLSLVNLRLIRSPIAEAAADQVGVVGVEPVVVAAAGAVVVVVEGEAVGAEVVVVVEEGGGRVQLDGSEEITRTGGRAWPTA